MNPSPVEEAGSTVRLFMEKVSPATLVLSVANVALLVFMFYALVKAAEFRDSTIKNQFEYQQRMAELLSKCVVPPQ